MFPVGSFVDESILGGKDEVFEIDTIGLDAHATTGGSFVRPAEQSEPYDLFKLQDEEAMDALDPTKEPPGDWEPGPEDEVELEAGAHTQCDDRHDGFATVSPHLDHTPRDPVRSAPHR